MMWHRLDFGCFFRSTSIVDGQYFLLGLNLLLMERLSFGLKMSSSKSRKGRDKPIKELKARGLLNLGIILAQDEKLMSLISECKDFAIVRKCL